MGASSRAALRPVLALSQRGCGYLLQCGDAQAQLLQLHEQLPSLLDRHAQPSFSHVSLPRMPKLMLLLASPVLRRSRTCSRRHRSRSHTHRSCSRSHSGHAVRSLPWLASLAAFCAFAGPRQPQSHAACSWTWSGTVMRSLLLLTKTVHAFAAAPLPPGPHDVSVQVEAA